MRPVILTGLFLGFLLPVTVVAQYPNVLLTPSERTAMLAERSNSSDWSKLRSNVAASAANTPSYLGNHRTRYLAASLGDRVAIAQIIGEEGVEQYASTRRMKQLLGPRGRSVPFGPDSVYWNPASGKVSVLEAKGGSSQPKWTYGSRQGTNTNTIRSAKGILQSRGAAMTEKLQAARVIKAAQSGHLESAVIRTQHVLGSPLAPQQVGSVDVGYVAKEARLIQHELDSRHPELRPVFRQAGIMHESSRAAHFGAASLPRSRASRLSAAASMSGLTSVGGRGLRIALQAGNRFLLPVGLGFAGIAIVNYGYQYAMGHIDQYQLVGASGEFMILTTFTVTGAAFGGFSSLGIGAIPGAMIGATLALPVQVYLWFSNENSRQPGDSNPNQMAVVDRVLEEIYLAKIN